MSGEITIATWIKLDAGAVDELNSVFNSDSLYRMKIPLQAGNKFEFGYRSNLAQSAAPVSSEWTHVAGTWDGDTLRLYINDVLDADLAASAPGALFNVAPQIGRGEPQGDALHPFDGLIDALATYNRALSAEEILKLIELEGGLP